jgi:heme-degrading monooxygenase HmoA
LVRYVTLLKFEPGTTDDQITAMLEGAVAMLAKQRGILSHSLGRDLGLRDNSMSFGAVIDFEDEDAYSAFHADDEHNRFRREVLAHIVESSALCHYRV